MRHRRFTTSAMSILVVLLAGCASVAPATEATRTPAPTPTVVPDVAPVATSAVVGALGITILDADGTALEELPFTDPAPSLIASLTTLFGVAPALSERAGGHVCVGPASLAVWDGFTLTFDIEGWTVAGHSTFVQASARETANGIRLVTASGFGVGDSVAALRAAQPGVVVDSVEAEGAEYSSIHYDVAAGEPLKPDESNRGEGPYWGAMALGRDGEIVLLQSPQTFVDAC